MKRTFGIFALLTVSMSLAACSGQSPTSLASGGAPDPIPGGTTGDSGAGGSASPAGNSGGGNATPVPSALRDRITDYGAALRTASLKLVSALPTLEQINAVSNSKSPPTKLSEIARALITTAKAFHLGLTQSVVVPAMMDDTHGAFADMNNLGMTVAALGKYLDEFMADLAMVQDPLCSARTMADTLVLTVHGDTPKDPRNKQGWPDGTPMNSNWLYAMGNGWLKTGWFGGVHASGDVDGFDPTTGDAVPGQQSNATSDSAAAAVAFAVAKGDMRRVNDFYTGPAIDGVVNASPIQ